MQHESDRGHCFVERRGRQSAVEKARHAPMVRLWNERCDARGPTVAFAGGPRERQIVRRLRFVVGRSHGHQPTDRTGSPTTTGYGAPMRIVAGTARGRRIEAPEGRTTRPTLDRVRQAIFNALDAREMVRGAVVLDLFGGSGALAFEALSRGATSATIVEQDRAAIQFVHSNSAALGFASQVKVVRSDVTRWLDGGGAAALQPTLVLADPPYEWNQWPALLAALPASVSCVVVETGFAFDEPPGWDVLRAQRYGGTVVTMLAPAIHEAVAPDLSATGTDEVVG